MTAAQRQAPKVALAVLGLLLPVHLLHALGAVVAAFCASDGPQYVTAVTNA
ncbi:hypothetical protein BH20ACT17_BH20ACT17_11870 [soil metagenome]